MWHPADLAQYIHRSAEVALNYADLEICIAIHGAQKARLGQSDLAILGGDSGWPMSQPRGQAIPQKPRPQDSQGSLSKLGPSLNLDSYVGPYVTLFHLFTGPGQARRNCLGQEALGTDFKKASQKGLKGSGGGLSKSLEVLLKALQMPSEGLRKALQDL